MNCLFLLTYYRPHISGLTQIAANRAEAMTARGHSVTVLTSRHRDELPAEETVRGVRVLRRPVMLRAGKGVVMRGYQAQLGELVESSDVVVLWLPATPPEAWSAARWARRLGKPLLIEYACDLHLPCTWTARLIETTAGWGHGIAARAASAITVGTEDYAAASPFAAKFRDKVRILPHTIAISKPRPDEVLALRSLYAPKGERLIGFAGRLAAEKGLEVLADALPRIVAGGHNARLLLAGNSQTVIGESKYRRKTLDRLAALRDRCHVLGIVEPDLASFYAACDVLVLPSLNSTESFGLVQAEAMLCGTPVVASDLPGVRMPVSWTGMGRLVAAGDAGALAGAICDVLSHRQQYVQSPEDIRQRFSALDSIVRFEALVEEVMR